jgi:AcrR family transcriptional regulator
MVRPRTGIEPRIVHAARARFLAEGVDGASLRTIARDARTSVGMISYYFPSKDDLFLAVVEEVYAKLLDDVEAALSSAPTVREGLTRAFARVGNTSDLEIEVVRLVVREALLSSARLERIVARAQRGHLRVFAAALARGVASGEIDDALPLPILVVSTLAMGGVPQLVRRTLGTRAPVGAMPGAEELAEISAGLLLRAIGTRSAGKAGEAKNTLKGRRRSGTRG